MTNTDNTTVLYYEKSLYVVILYTQYYSALSHCNIVRLRAAMRHQHALLKRLLRSERATGAWAIVNHHTDRFWIDSGALDHDNTMTIFFFKSHRTTLPDRCGRPRGRFGAAEADTAESG